MIYIIQLMIYLLSPMPEESNITCTRFGSESLIDNIDEKVVGARWVDWGDGSLPGFYWLVKYDYKEPPQYWEIAQWYINGQKDSVIGNWKLEKEELLSISGDYALGVFILKTTKVKPSGRYLAWYADTIIVSIGEKFSLEIKTQNISKDRIDQIDKDFIKELSTPTPIKPDWLRFMSRIINTIDP